MLLIIQVQVDIRVSCSILYLRDRIPSKESFEWSAFQGKIPSQMLRKIYPSKGTSFANDFGRMSIRRKNHSRMISVIWHSKRNRLQMFSISTNLPLTFRLHAKNVRRHLISFYLWLIKLIGQGKLDKSDITAQDVVRAFLINIRRVVWLSWLRLRM